MQGVLRKKLREGYAGEGKVYEIRGGGGLAGIFFWGGGRSHVKI